MLYSVFLFFLGALLKTSQSSVAYFSYLNSGVEGYVAVGNRWISVWIDLTWVDTSLLPGGASCLSEGLHYHIHDTWGYSDSYDRIGATNCGSLYTGGHYDPYLACGPKSNSVYCETSSGGCVTSSSVMDSTNVYNCTSSNYLENPYVCEVGDLSGKYGTLEIYNNITVANISSFWEVTSADVQGKTIVFHCANTDQRAFCAPFDNTTDIYYDVFFEDNTNDDLYLIAYIPDNFFPAALFAFLPDGEYGAFIFYDSFQTCTDYIYRIYDSWLSNNYSLMGDTACRAAVGQVWDPTVSCCHGSDSNFCEYEYRLCNDSSYSYKCDYINDRYSCAPGDLSGKYGWVNFWNATNGSAYAASGFDFLLPPLDQLIGKSIAIECSDYSQIVACAEILNVTQSYYLNITFNNTWNYSQWNSTWNYSGSNGGGNGGGNGGSSSTTSPPVTTSGGNFYHLSGLFIFIATGLTWMQLM